MNLFCVLVLGGRMSARRFALCLTALGVAVGISIGIQAGLKEAAIVIALCILGGLLLLPTYRLIRRKAVLTTLLASLPILGFFHFIGTSHVWLDISCVLLSITLPIYVMRYFQRRHCRATGTIFSWSQLLRLRTAALIVITFWLATSAADSLFPVRPNVPAGNRLTPAFLTSNNAHLAVALSGGGYRAALFHAGVFSVLEVSNIRPQALSSVSGGSIFAAFYAAGGTPEQFRQLVELHAFNLKRQLFDAQTLLHLLAATNIWSTHFTLLPIADYTRTMAQADMLDRIFLDKKTFSSLRQDGPDLMLCTTDILGQSMMGFTGHGVVLQPISVSEERSHFSNPVKFDWGRPAPPRFEYYKAVGLSDPPPAVDSGSEAIRQTTGAQAGRQRIFRSRVN